jgi:hypothetical protein
MVEDRAPLARVWIVPASLHASSGMDRAAPASISPARRRGSGEA